MHDEKGFLALADDNAEIWQAGTDVVERICFSAESFDSDRSVKRVTGIVFFD